MTTLNEYYQFIVFYLLKLWNNYRNIGSFIGNKESKKKNINTNITQCHYCKTFTDNAST